MEKIIAGKIITRIFSLLMSVLVTFGIIGSSQEIIETGEKTTKLTQTSVVLSEPKFDFSLKNFSDNLEKGFTIPGLYEGFVPQGIFYEETNDVFLISGYYEEKALTSRIAVVSGDGEFVKSVGLVSKKGNYAYGHFGGIAVFADNVYVASTSLLHLVSLEDILSAEDDGYVLIQEELYTDVTCSFANVNDGVLYVGQFTDDITVSARCNAFVLDENGKFGFKTGKITGENFIIPDYTFSVPWQAQGMVRLSDGKFVFSTSAGSILNGLIYVYEDFTKCRAADTVMVEENEVPFYKITAFSLRQIIEAPTYIEEMTISKNGKICIVAESAADPYRKKDKNPIDFVMIFDIDAALR